MFQAVFRRAQAAVETSIDQAINRTIMMVPFLVAAGFATAALAYRLNRAFGPETGNLLMAALCVAVGVLTAAVMSSRQKPATDAVEVAAQPEAIATEGKEATSSPLADVDRELITAALTSIAPMAVPQVLRMVTRNLPLIAAIAAGMFVISRPVTSNSNPPDPHPAPA